MNKTIFFSLIIAFLTTNFSLANTINTYDQKPALPNLPSSTISAGLKEALNLGVNDGVSILSKKDGFYKNTAVKILLPKEFNNVEKTLRNVGLGSLVTQTVRLINRAAEDAVTEAGPIFLGAIKSINFNDASSILMGGNSAATNYLEKNTDESLNDAFEPKIAKSLSKLGADKAWEDMISKYNAISRNNQVNENLTEYVTEETLNGLFKMIGDKENHIRGDKSARKTPLLKTVFALQDSKIANPKTGKIIKKTSK